MDFSGILICTDLDGTLLNSQHRISQENLDAIEYFKANGGYFTFITGRMPFYKSNFPLYEAVKPNAPIGCINGGGVFDLQAKQYVWTQQLPHKALELVQLVHDRIPAMGYQINAFDKVFFCRDDDVMVLFRKTTGLPELSAPLQEIFDPLAKVIFGIQSEEELAQLVALLESHPASGDFDYIRSEKTLYEILPKGVSKGAVLPKLAEHLHIDPQKIIAVGDYNNDISMLQQAGLGIAVANATEGAKAAANRITVSNDQHAIAQIIADLESGAIQL